MDKSLDEMIANLDPEEREILESYERGELHSVPDWQARLPEYQTSAQATLDQLGLIPVALSTEDLEEVRERADKAGVPSDVFIANIVHQFVTGDLIRR